MTILAVIGVAIAAFMLGFRIGAHFVEQSIDDARVDAELAAWLEKRRARNGS